MLVKDKSLPINLLLVKSKSLGPGATYSFCSKRCRGHRGVGLSKVRQ